MIPNLWVGYKLTKKFNSAGTPKNTPTGRAPKLSEEEEAEAQREFNKDFSTICKTALILYVLFFFVAFTGILDFAIPNTCALGCDTEEQRIHDGEKTNAEYYGEDT